MFQTGIFTCHFCGTDINFETGDKEHGMIWTCESCGEDFCEKCFCDRHGEPQWFSMYRDAFEEPHGLILCPECYTKRITYRED